MNDSSGNDELRYAIMKNLKSHDLTVQIIYRTNIQEVKIIMFFEKT